MVRGFGLAMYICFICAVHEDKCSGRKIRQKTAVQKQSYTGSKYRSSCAKRKYAFYILFTYVSFQNARNYGNDAKYVIL